VANELGRNPSDVVQHFREYIGAEAADRIIASVTEQLRNPFDFFDAIYCINLDSATERWQAVMARFEKLGIASRIRRFPAISTPSNPHIGCALSHREIIQEAQRQGLNNVLVFEDDVMFTADACSHLEQALRELDGREWDLLYLGACCWEHTFPMVEGCSRLQHAGPATTCHAIAYRESTYARLLAAVPSDAGNMQAWLEDHHAIDQYYAFSILHGKFLVSPVIATQENLLPYEPVEVRQRIPA
jgi:GR25 family glycosyltransferase involved in LPS biosynthesis